MSGRSIYFSEQEICMIINYISEATSILGESEETCEQVDKDMKQGLGSALKKLYKGKIGEANFSEYKTPRTKKHCPER